MQQTEERHNERLDHLGIVAGICQELGLATWLDALVPGQQRTVSYGTATVAMILNSLGFTNKKLSLIPQFFTNKAVAHLLGAGISADMLNADCLGQTLDWLYEQDVTALFSDIAHHARQRFHLPTRYLHVHTTSFLENGTYKRDKEQKQVIAITHGSLQDHHEDLKQWMIGLVTTYEDDIPLFLRPLAGQSGDEASLMQALADLDAQLHARQPDERPIYVTASDLYNADNMRILNQAQVRWVSLVPATNTEAIAIVQQDEQPWQSSADGTYSLIPLRKDLPQGSERWLVVRSQQSIEQAFTKVRQQTDEELEAWKKKLWHLSCQKFDSEQDAVQEGQNNFKDLPAWLQVNWEVQSRAVFERSGRPSRDAQPIGTRWSVHGTVTLKEDQVQAEAMRKACFIIATNLTDDAEVPHEELISLYQEQGSVERGFQFLKYPRFLATQLFLKTPERTVALSLVMALALLVYRLAEQRLHQQLAATGQTIPDQVNEPTDRPDMRWVFQYFEGLELSQTRTESSTQAVVLHLQPLHEQILSLLGPAYQQFYVFPD